MRSSTRLPLFVNGVTALLLSQPVMAQPNADKAPMHVVMVSPRGETSMEREFKSEFQQRHAGPVKFSFIKPDTTNDQEMNGLPARIRAMKPDLIYTWGTPTTLAVAGTEDKPVIKDIPVFFTVVAYPARVEINRSRHVQCAQDGLGVIGNAGITIIKTDRHPHWLGAFDPH